MGSGGGLSRRPSRPIQASRAAGATWRRSTNGTEAWWSLASADARWGWVERVWGTWLVTVAHGNPSRLRDRKFTFSTKRRAMRWLESMAVAETRRIAEQERRRAKALVEQMRTYPGHQADYVDALTFAFRRIVGVDPIALHLGALNPGLVTT